MPAVSAPTPQARSPCGAEKAATSPSNSNGDDLPSRWKNAAAKAADNLLRILREIELDIPIDEGIRESLKSFESATEPEHKKKATPKSGEVHHRKRSNAKEEVKENSSGEANTATTVPKRRQKGTTETKKPLSPSKSRPLSPLERVGRMPQSHVAPTSPAQKVDLRQLKDAIRNSRANAEARASRLKVDLTAVEAEARQSKPNVVKDEITPKKQVPNQAKAKARAAKVDPTKGKPKAQKSKETAKTRSKEKAAGETKQKAEIAMNCSPTKSARSKDKANVKGSGKKTTKKKGLEKKSLPSTVEKEAKQPAKASTASDDRDDCAASRRDAEPEDTAKEATEIDVINSKKQFEDDRVANEERERRERQKELDSAKQAEADRRQVEVDTAKRVEAERKREADRIAEDQRRSKEQVQLVENVLTANNGGKDSFYTVLGLSTNASEADVKRAYRKLSLRIHPDKNNADRASEAFHAVASAYEVLKSPTTRAEYDRQGQALSESAPPTGTSAAPTGPTQSEQNTSFDVIPTGTSITVQSEDVRFSHLNGTKGSIMAHDPREDLYTVKLDNDTLVLSKASALFQNVIVCLRAFAAQELGVFLVTLASYYGQVYYGRYGGGKQMATLQPQDFIIPNGTVVRLDGLVGRVDLNGRYGTVINWTERIEGTDSSYYDVQLSNTVIVRVTMANAHL